MNSRVSRLVVLFIALISVLSGCSWSTSTENELDNWMGGYYFEEHHLTPENPVNSMFWHYDIQVHQEQGIYFAHISMNGWMMYEEIQTKVVGDLNSIDLVFEKYLYNNATSKYQEGDVLFTLRLVDGKLETIWGKLQPVLTHEQNESGMLGFEQTDKILTSSENTISDTEEMLEEKANKIFSYVWNAPVYWKEVIKEAEKHGLVENDELTLEHQNLRAIYAVLFQDYINAQLVESESQLKEWGILPDEEPLHGLYYFTIENFMHVERLSIEELALLRDFMNTLEFQSTDTYPSKDLEKYNPRTYKEMILTTCTDELRELVMNTFYKVIPVHALDYVSTTNPSKTREEMQEPYYYFAPDNNTGVDDLVLEFHRATSAKLETPPDGF